MILQSYPTAKPTPRRVEGDRGVGVFSQKGWAYLVHNYLSCEMQLESLTLLVANMRIDTNALNCFSIQKVVASVRGWGCS